VVGISPSVICVWESCHGQLIQRIDSFLGNCSHIATHPSLASVVFVGCSDGQYTLWDVTSGEFLQVLQAMDTPHISSAHWSPDGTFLIVTGKLGGAEIICTNSNEPMSTSEQFLLRRFLREPTTRRALSASQWNSWILSLFAGHLATFDSQST
jgi:WD40 repeat protein